MIDFGENTDAYEYFNENALSSKERNELKDSDFGIPELRKYPLTDEEHVRKANSFFKFAPKKYKAELAKRILNAAKKFDIDTENWQLHEYLSKHDTIQESAELHGDAIDICHKIYDFWNGCTYGIRVGDKLITPDTDPEWESHYRFLSYDEFVETKTGICWDYTNYARHVFLKNHIPFKQYFMMCEVPGYMTHTFVLCDYEDDQVVLVESAFKEIDDMIGGIKVFDNFREATRFIASMMFSLDSISSKVSSFKYDVIEFHGHPQYHSTGKEYVEWMYERDENEVVYQSTATIEEYHKFKEEMSAGKHMYFYHLLPNDVHLDSKGLKTPEYVYKVEGNRSLYLQMVDKYRNRLCNGWGIYPDRDPDSLAPKEIYDGINKFRQDPDGNNRIYMFRYPPTPDLGPNMKKTLDGKTIYAFDILNPKNKEYIKSIHWGFKDSHTENEALTREYYEDITPEEYFANYDDDSPMLFASLSHISITPSKGYIPKSRLRETDHMIPEKHNKKGDKLMKMEQIQEFTSPINNIKENITGESDLFKHILKVGLSNKGILQESLKQIEKQNLKPVMFIGFMNPENVNRTDLKHLQKHVVYAADNDTVYTSFFNSFSRRNEISNIASSLDTMLSDFDKRAVKEEHIPPHMKDCMITLKSEDGQRTVHSRGNIPMKFIFNDSFYMNAYYAYFAMYEAMEFCESQLYKDISKTILFKFDGDESKFDFEDIEVVQETYGSAKINMRFRYDNEPYIIVVPVISLMTKPCELFHEGARDEVSDEMNNEQEMTPQMESVMEIINMMNKRDNDIPEYVQESKDIMIKEEVNEKLTEQVSEPVTETKPYQEMAENGLIKVNNIKHNIMYFGSDIDFGENSIKLNKPELFLTPFIGLASIFTTKRSRYGIPPGLKDINLAYEEWYSPELDKPFDEIHVTVEGCPELNERKFEATGYIYAIDISEYKDNIYQKDWMDSNKEFLLCDVPLVPIREKIEHPHIVYVKGADRREISDTDDNCFYTNFHVPITKENVEKYKTSGNAGLTVGLQHLRVNPNVKGFIWPTKNDDEVIAYVAVERKPEGMFIIALEIAKRYQGKGFGKKLLTFAEKELEADHLTVNKKNDSAFKLYLDNGWEVYDETDHMYFMKKENEYKHHNEDNDDENTDLSSGLSDAVDELADTIKSALEEESYSENVGLMTQFIQEGSKQENRMNKFIDKLDHVPTQEELKQMTTDKVPDTGDPREEQLKNQSPSDYIKHNTDAKHVSKEDKVWNKMPSKTATYKLDGIDPNSIKSKNVQKNLKKMGYDPKDQTIDTKVPDPKDHDKNLRAKLYVNDSRSGDIGAFVRTSEDENKDVAPYEIHMPRKQLKFRNNAPAGIVAHENGHIFDTEHPEATKDIGNASRDKIQDNIEDLSVSYETKNPDDTTTQKAAISPHVNSFELIADTIGVRNTSPHTMKHDLEKSNSYMNSKMSEMKNDLKDIQKTSKYKAMLNNMSPGEKINNYNDEIESKMGNIAIDKELAFRKKLAANNDLPPVDTSKLTKQEMFSSFLRMQDEYIQEAGQVRNIQMAYYGKKEGLSVEQQKLVTDYGTLIDQLNTAGEFYKREKKAREKEGKRLQEEYARADDANREEIKERIVNINKELKDLAEDYMSDRSHITEEMNRLADEYDKTLATIKVRLNLNERTCYKS